MDNRMLSGGKWIAAALAAITISFWALRPFNGAPPVPVAAPPAVEAPAPAAVETPAPAAVVKPKRTARKRIASAPSELRKPRISPLRDKGEAFGGTAPDPVEKSTAPAR